MEISILYIYISYIYIYINLNNKLTSSNKYSFSSAAPSFCTDVQNHSAFTICALTEAKSGNAFTFDSSTT